MINKIHKIFSFINIHADNNQKWILVSMLFSVLLITYASPCVTKATITELPAEWLAFQSLFGSVSGLFVGIIWKNKTRDMAIKHFLAFALTESILGCSLGLYLCFINWNVWIYAIVSLIYTSFISTFVGKCVMTFKPKMWNDRDREVFDNNISIVSGAACIIGFGGALLYMPSLKLAILLWAICCIIDDIGWIYAYYKNMEFLKK